MVMRVRGGKTMSRREVRNARDRRPRPSAELLEARLQPSTVTPALSGGVDALALGDVNGDRVVDLVVAGRQAGHYVVTIYDGVGTQDQDSPTSADARPLARLVDPLGKGVGPLSVAVGDFDGDGVSDLAVAAAAPGGGARVATYRFQLPAGALPIDQPVTPVRLASAFVPPGLGKSRGLSLAAGDLDGEGRDELIVGTAVSGPSALDVMQFTAAGGWRLDRTISLASVRMHAVSLSAGDLTGDGVSDIAAVSHSDGRVAVFTGATSTWSATMTPLSRRSTDSRVAIVASEGAPGALVVTPGTRSARVLPALVSWPNHLIHQLQLPGSPGRGGAGTAGRRVGLPAEHHRSGRLIPVQ
jgi:hypothetical protein